jgi:hypothetical protein
LIKDALKTLLGMPFISRIKMEIKYRNDGFQDARFIDLETSITCVTMIVLALKEEVRRESIKPLGYKTPWVSDESGEEGEVDESKGN